MICIAVKPGQSKRSILRLLGAGFRVMATRDALLSPKALDGEIKLSYSTNRAKFHKALLQRLKAYQP